MNTYNTIQDYIQKWVNVSYQYSGTLNHPNKHVEDLSSERLDTNAPTMSVSQAVYVIRGRGYKSNLGHGRVRRNTTHLPIKSIIEKVKDLSLITQYVQGVRYCQKLPRNQRYLVLGRISQYTIKTLLGIVETISKSVQLPNLRLYGRVSGIFRYQDKKMYAVIRQMANIDGIYFKKQTLNTQTFWFNNHRVNISVCAPVQTSLLPPKWAKSIELYKCTHEDHPMALLVAQPVNNGIHIYFQVVLTDKHFRRRILKKLQQNIASLPDYTSGLIK
jgi:hypothetical protein